MSTRVEARLDALYRIGGGRGANRPGLGAGEQEAHRLAASWMREAGLEVSRDAVGNTYGRRPGSDPTLPEVWTGSHLDSVPAGGRFDGALGVVAAIEALVRLPSASLSRTVAAVAFRDEEGTRFGRGFFGSRAVCGRLEAGELETCDRAGVSVAAALAALGIDPPDPARTTAPLPGLFLEAHVEQGPVLADADAPLGVVRSIVGMAGLRVRFVGAAGHAGTVPLARRRDALVAAAAYVTLVRRAAARVAHATATVGELVVAEGAGNVIPGRADVTVDVRAPELGELDRLLAEVEELAHTSAAAEGCVAEVDRLARHPPVTLDPDATEVLARAARSARCEPLELVSGAGHDAGILAAAGVPTAMLFVRSGGGGASHSPAEMTDSDAVERCVDALAAALAELAARPVLWPPIEADMVEPQTSQLL